MAVITSKTYSPQLLEDKTIKGRRTLRYMKEQGLLNDEVSITSLGVICSLLPDSVDLDEVYRGKTYSGVNKDLEHNIFVNDDAIEFGIPMEYTFHIGNKVEDLVQRWYGEGEFYQERLEGAMKVLPSNFGVANAALITRACELSFTEDASYTLADLIKVADLLDVSLYTLVN